MEIAAIVLSFAAAVLAAIVLVKLAGLKTVQEKSVREIKELVDDELDEHLARTANELEGSLRGIGDSNIAALNTLGTALQTNQRLSGDKQAAEIKAFEEKTSVMLRGQKELVDSLVSGVTEQMNALRNEVRQQIDSMDKSMTAEQKQLNENVSARLAQLQASVTDQMNQMVTNIHNLEQSNEGKLETMRSSIAESMTAMREENGRKLDEIRGTVDEKLQTTLEKRISESFKTVSDQLEQVYKGLGEMQTLATDVGGLKKVLSGVKTRGILGEVQLGAILEEILSPEQYETNVATVPGSSERVEFAVKLPGREGTVYLPIDSKFPGDRYAQLLEAQESGEKDKIEAAYRALENVIRSEAKDIVTKYVEVPYTTNFGIMFLPFEGLYAEVVNRGLIEALQRDYHINVAGPSTMAALLNSLQMGFRTLAIQKRSNEVWEVLGAVKTEFGKFGDVMLKMQGHLNQTSNDLESLMGTRSRAIERKLRQVQQLDDSASEDILELGETD